MFLSYPVGEDIGNRNLHPNGWDAGKAARSNIALAPSDDQQLCERDMGSSSFGFSTAAWSAIGEPANIGTVHGVGDDVRGIARG
jgi:hypothetical protein